MSDRFREIDWGATGNRARIRALGSGRPVRVGFGRMTEPKSRPVSTTVDRGVADIETRFEAEPFPLLKVRLLDGRFKKDRERHRTSRLRVDPGRVDEWIDPAPGELLTFRTAGVGPEESVPLRPFYDVHQQRSAVYWTVHASGS